MANGERGKRQGGGVSARFDIAARIATRIVRLDIAAMLLLCLALLLLSRP
jgi:hypothetical protein